MLEEDYVDGSLIGGDTIPLTKISMFCALSQNC